MQPDPNLEQPSSKSFRTTFVSHASEDKPFVKDLVDTLIRYGVDPWYDEYQIRPGDSIRERVNDGLRSSNYGILILSHNFYAKQWPKEELAALHNLVAQGNLLPVFYGITVADLRTYDPLLVDVRGIMARDDADVREVVAPLARTILGSDRIENGRLVYRNETVSLASVPRNEFDRIANATFEDCVLQGPAILVAGENVLYQDLLFNSPDVFIVAPPATKFVGAIGIENTTFIRCRFKDVGFVVDSKPDLPTVDSPLIPAHLH